MTSVAEANFVRLGGKAMGDTAIALGERSGTKVLQTTRSGRPHSRLPDAFAFLVQAVLFCSKGLNLFGYFCVVTIYTVPTTLYIASFRPPTSSWASQMRSRARAIGTSPDAIAKTEAELGLRLPPSFRNWLIQKNGLGINGVTIFPVFDERDPRKTWDSIVRNSKGAKSYWYDVFADDGRSFEDLLAFAEFGTGDYYCFDYSSPTEPGEFMVVHVSHETGERSARARTFSEFAEKVAAGEFDND